MRGSIAWNGASTGQEVETMRRSNFALRLQPSLMEEARKAAQSEGVALNQLINVALAEKVSALRTEEYFPGTSSTCGPRGNAKNSGPSWKRKSSDKGRRTSTRL